MTRLGTVSLSFGLVALLGSSALAAIWTAGPPLPGPRREAAAVIVGNSVLLTGGRLSTSAVTDSVEAFDTISNTWSSVAPLPEPRTLHAAGLIGGKLYVAGGFTPYLASTARAYDPTTNAWASIASMPIPNCGMGCGVVGGKLYVFGGGDASPPLDSAYCYDPVADAWHPVFRLPHARKIPASAVLDGLIYIIGGHTGISGVNDATSYVDVYHPPTNSYSPAPDLPVALTAAAAVACNGRVWVTGGVDGTLGFGKLSGVYSYRPGEHAWRVEPSLPEELGGLAAVTSSASTIWTFGGIHEAEVAVASVHQLVVHEPDIVSITDVPNDQGGKVSIRWTASFLDRTPGDPIGAYWIWRQVPTSAAQTALANGGHLAEAGPMTARLAGRAVRMTAQGTNVYYWEYLGSQVAHGFPAYSYTAVTLFDSIPGSNPKTLFMVEAEHVSTGDYWSSAPDSGFSIDNLAPSTPGPLATTWNERSTTLHWPASADEDLSHYNVYRGTAPGFPISPAGRVASTTDTAYVDPAGKPYWYEITTVDLHGNESPAAGSSGVLAVDAPDAPALALAAPQPNPARTNALLRFTLSREGRAAIAIFDVGGRRVRELAAGPMTGGAHAIRFELRDDSGQRLGSGLYFLRMEAEGATLSTKLAIIP